MTKDEALKMTLEALEADPLEMVADVDGHMVFLKDKAITAIKEALAQPEQEPVAWVCYGAPGKRDIDFEEADINGLSIGTSLYTIPPQRTWVGLDEEDDIDWEEGGSLRDLVEAIEAKLKQKNGYAEEKNT